MPSELEASASAEDLPGSLDLQFASDGTFTLAESTRERSRARDEVSEASTESEKSVDTEDGERESSAVSGDDGPTAVASVRERLGGASRWKPAISDALSEASSGTSTHSWNLPQARVPGQLSHAQPPKVTSLSFLEAIGILETLFPGTFTDAEIPELAELLGAADSGRVDVSELRSALALHIESSPSVTDSGRATATGARNATAPKYCVDHARAGDAPFVEGASARFTGDSDLVEISIASTAHTVDSHIMATSCYSRYIAPEGGVMSPPPPTPPPPADRPPTHDPFPSVSKWSQAKNVQWGVRALNLLDGARQGKAPPKMNAAAQVKRDCTVKQLTMSSARGGCTRDRKWFEDAVDKSRLATWQILYCGGSQLVVNSLREISHRNGIAFRKEKFDW